MSDKEQLNIFDRIQNVVSIFYNWIDEKSNKIKNGGRKRSFIWLITIIVCFSCVLFLNILTPLISDDFAYMFIYGENMRISSVNDIIQSQINHYNMWGGRSIVHFIAQLLLMLPAYVADLLNSLIYMGYIYLIYMHIKGRNKGSMSLFVLINLSVWFLQPVFGDTVLWITGASNYLWGTFFILLFLLPYRLYEGKGFSGVLSIFVSLGLFLFGIVAGWTNENTAGAMILIALSFFYYYRIQNWKIPMWAISGFIGAIIGFSIMILAPGNFERAGEGGSLSLYLIGYRLFNSTLTFFYYGGSAILAFLLIWFIYSKNGKDKDNNMYLNLIYTIAAIAAVYAMLFSPTFPRRALFGVVTFLIIGMGILYYNMDFMQRILRQLRLSVLLVGFVSFIFTFYLAFKEINLFKEIMTERDAQIKQAKEEGKVSCQFERFDGGIYIHGEDPYSEELMSKYYGIKIKLVAPD